MLENGLHLADFVSVTEYTPVMLRVLAHLVCLPGLASVLHSEYRGRASAGRTHVGPWIVVAAQVAVRVAASWASANNAVLAVMLARVLLKTAAVPEGHSEANHCGLHQHKGYGCSSVVREHCAKNDRRRPAGEVTGGGPRGARPFAEIARGAERARMCARSWGWRKRGPRGASR
jgi:hypothetical protein